MINKTEYYDGDPGITNYFPLHVRENFSMGDTFQLTLKNKPTTNLALSQFVGAVFLADKNPKVSILNEADLLVEQEEASISEARGTMGESGADRGWRGKQVADHTEMLYCRPW